MAEISWKKKNFKKANKIIRGLSKESALKQTMPEAAAPGHRISGSRQYLQDANTGPSPRETDTQPKQRKGLRLNFRIHVNFVFCFIR